MMKVKNVLASLAVFTVVAALAQTALAQAFPTATQRLQLSTFGAATTTTSALPSGKNTAVTAGADISFHHAGLFRPSMEIRATFPVNSTSTDRLKSYVFGPKFEYPLGHLHPYFDLLVGRGKIDYRNGGYIVGHRVYLSSVSIIYSPGVGVDVDLTHTIGLMADLQYQHWDAPVINTGTINPTALTLGAVYTFDFNQRRRPRIR
jgi:hypothetical protein